MSAELTSTAAAEGSNSLRTELSAAFRPFSGQTAERKRAQKEDRRRQAEGGKAHRQKVDSAHASPRRKLLELERFVVRLGRILRAGCSWRIRLG